MTAPAQVATKRRREAAELPEGDRLVRKATVCRMVDVPARSLDRAIAAGQFPRATHRLGKSPRWKLSMIERYIAGDGSPAKR